jgi:hypothetical protein
MLQVKRVKDRVRTPAGVQNMNRNLRVRPNSEGLTSKIRREILESYINVDGLPVGNAQTQDGWAVQTCKP